MSTRMDKNGAHPVIHCSGTSPAQPDPMHALQVLMLSVLACMHIAGFPSSPGTTFTQPEPMHALQVLGLPVLPCMHLASTMPLTMRMLP